MLLILISLMVSLLLLWCYRRWSEVRRYWKDRGVPHNPPNPIWGSLTFLLRQNPALWMRQIYQDFKSPYVGIWVFWRPGLVINSPEIARRVLVKDSDIFRNRYLGSGNTDPIGGLNLFTVNDPLWTQVRRRLTSVFTSAKLRYHNEITIAKSKDLVERVVTETAKNKYIDLRTVFTDYTTDVIGESAFGISCETTKTGSSIMKNLTKDFMEFNLYRGLCWSSIFFFPALVDIFRFSFFPKKTVEQLREIYRSIVSLRGGYQKDMKEAKDMLDALIKLKQESVAANEEMTEDVLLSQAAIFLQAGFETSASAMSWLIYMLAWNPKYQEILYDEIYAAKQQVGDKDLDSTILSGLTYLTCVMKESLRLYPPMGWLDRIADKDYRIDENLTIKAGTVIYVNAIGIQVDPEYFPDPFTFNPDRFLPENEKKIKPYTFMPFGEGPRNCIGMRLAYQTMRQGIASLILNYEFKSVPGTPKPIDVGVEHNGLLYTPLDKNMVVEFVPRKRE